MATQRSNARVSHRTVIGSMVLLWPLLSAPMGAGRARADPMVPEAVRTQARGLLTAAQLAFDSGKLDLARQQAEASYRLFPSARILLHLANIEAARGRLIEAADLARRYLSAPPAEASEAERARARYLAARPREGAAQLELRGPEGAWVSVDDRLMGTLPLPLPLLVPAGPHSVRIDRDGQARTRVVALARGAQQVVEMDLPLPILPLPGRGLAASWPGVRARLVSLTEESGVDLRVAGTALEECRGDLPCQRQLAARLGARHVLQLDVTASGGGGCAVTAELLPVTGSALGTRREISLARCREQDFATPLLALAREVIDLRARPAGLLRVEIDGGRRAEVFVDERPAGAVPLRAPLPPADHRVMIRDRGEVLHQGLVTVEPGGGASLSLHRERERRPTWRLITGALTGAASAALAGVGGAIWRLHDQRVPAPGGGYEMTLIDGRSRFVTYDTMGLGAGLVTAGVTGAAASLLLALLPGRARYQAVRAASGRPL